MRRSLHDRRDSARSAAIVGAIHLALGWALLTGLGVTPRPPVLDQPLALIDLTDEPDPPPPVVPMVPERTPKPTRKPKDPEGAAAPPDLRNTPTEVVAPKPPVVLPVPPPLPAAPVAGQGTAPAAGAAPVPGPGSGRGGIGNGLGSGLSGTGTGGGGGGGVAEDPEYSRGAIGLGDLPPFMRGRDLSGLVVFRVLVGRDGRPRNCRVIRSSGDPRLDSVTCAAALRRLRFDPARDTAGRLVEAWAQAEHEWSVRARPPDRWVDPVLESAN